MKYNKLVRDKIPEIIQEDGKQCVTRILNDDEYLTALNVKMQEELQEYLESGDIRELADLEEVLRAILSVKNVSYPVFDLIRKEKANERGAFENRIFLETVYDASGGDEKKQNKKPTEILYICDRKKCKDCCYPICKHTTDISHAVNFKTCKDGAYVWKKGEREASENGA
jgi:predicted house-cleaning noncanonical NTP pyrophosphatase (MazG superfamily)